MRRRAFIQLGGTFGATLLLPEMLSGCSPSEVVDSPPLPAPASETATKPGLVDTGTISVGEKQRFFTSDGASASWAPFEHRVDLFDASNMQNATIGGDMSAMGTGAIGSLNTPAAVAWDGTRYLVLERGASRIQAFSASGQPLGVVTETSLGAVDMTVDAQRNIYVVSVSQHRVEMYSAAGNLVRTFGRFGRDAQGLNGPTSIAISPSGALHVADAGNHLVKVWNLDGTFMGAYGNKGPIDGRLKKPTVVRFDGAGRAWVGDFRGLALRIYDERGSFMQKVPLSLNGSTAGATALTKRADGTMYATLVAAA